MQSYATTALWVGLLLLVGGSLYPVHNRLLLVGTISGFLLFWSWLVWRIPHGPWRKSIALLPALAVVPFILPGRALDVDVLRNDYVSRMRGFVGTKYVWGGESPLGIDCSGLPRRALRDALWRQGWRHGNGTAFRLWLAQWWNDESARAMGCGYRGWTRSLDLAGPLWRMDPAKIRPGDLAVRADGVHVVPYLGAGEWIEADPGRGKVRSWIPAASDGPWYEPMTVFRWTVLDDQPKP